MVTPRILREVEREIPEMGGGRVAVSFLFLSTKMTSTVLLRLRVKLLSFDHDSMCSISAHYVLLLLLCLCSQESTIGLRHTELLTRVQPEIWWPLSWF